MTAFSARSIVLSISMVPHGGTQLPKYGRLYLLPAVVVNNNLARVSGTGRIGERKEFARATVSGRDGPLRIARAKLFYQGPISPGRRRDIRQTDSWMVGTEALESTPHASNSPELTSAERIR